MHGDPRRSAALFGEVLKLDSLHAPTYYELANLFAQTPQQAIPYSRNALRLDSANTWYLTQLGQLYLGTKAYDSALRVYNKLLKLAPGNPDNYVRLAALYEQQGQPFFGHLGTRHGRNPFRDHRRSVRLQTAVVDQCKTVR